MDKGVSPVARYLRQIANRTSGGIGSSPNEIDICLEGTSIKRFDELNMMDITKLIVRTCGLQYRFKCTKEEHTNTLQMMN
jgi:hypothetical protein